MVQESSPHGPVRRGAYPEMTWPAIIVGWFLGSIIALSIGYASLILGFSIEGSELAAILGWGILRGIMRRTSIVENNINQTIASAVNGASAGMMFSIPALFILASENPEKYKSLTNFSPTLMVLSCVTGGILGLAFVIPLRRQMIDFNRLAYPGGIAVAAILKSPGAGIRKASFLLGGGVLSAAFYAAMLVTIGDHPVGHAGEFLGLPAYLNVSFFLSLMTVGVGFLSGRGGLVFGYGGFICYFLLAPLLSIRGHESVREMVHPEVPKTIVYAGNADDVDEILTSYAKLDADSAADLRAATGIDAYLTDESDSTDDSERASDAIAYDRLNGELAGKIVAAAERMKEEAGPDADDTVSGDTSDSGNTDGADAAIDGESNAPDWGKLSKELLSTTSADKIVKAAEIIDANPALLNAIKQTPGAEDLFASIRAQTSLTPEERKVLLEATGAGKIVSHIPDDLRYGMFRPTGIGILIGAAIGGIIAAAPLIRSAIRSMQEAAKEKADGSKPVSDEMSIRLLYLAVGVGSIVLATIAYFSVETMTLWRAVLMALLGTVWIWIAGVIVSECVGRTNWNPLSGMTLIAVTILVFITSGIGSSASILASVIAGAAICVAIAQAGDMMLDLKSGYLIGAQPKMQQYGQFLGTWLGPIVVISLIFILGSSYEFGGDKLPAPQGAALASVVNGIVGGDVPGWRYVSGIGIGGLLAFSGLGGVGVQIGLGFYMPFNIVLTYTIGCLIRMSVQRWCGMKFVDGVGIPFAAGLIVGEALAGVVNAFVQVFLS